MTSKRELSYMLEEARRERESNLSEARAWQNEASKLSTEGKAHSATLNTQIRALEIKLDVTERALEEERQHASGHAENEVGLQELLRDLLVLEPSLSRFVKNPDYETVGAFWDNEGAKMAAYHVSARRAASDYEAKKPRLAAGGFVPSQQVTLSEYDRELLRSMGTQNVTISGPTIGKAAKNKGAAA